MSILLSGQSLMTLGGAAIVGLGAFMIAKPDILNSQYSWYQTVYGVVVSPESAAELEGKYYKCHFKGQDKLENQFACEVNKLTVDPTDSTAAKTQVYSINASRDQLNGWKTKNIIVVNKDNDSTTAIELFFDAPTGTTKQFLVTDVSKEVSENISKYECSWTKKQDQYQPCTIRAAIPSNPIYMLNSSDFHSKITMHEFNLVLSKVKSIIKKDQNKYLIEFTSTNDKDARNIDGFQQSSIFVKATTRQANKAYTEEIEFTIISPYVYKNSKVGFQFSPQ